MSVARHPRTVALWVLLLLIDVAIQVGMKLAGDQLDSIPFGPAWIAAAGQSWLVWASLMGYAVTFVLWLAILHVSPLSTAFPLTAIVYALVPLAGWVLLGARWSMYQVAGIGLILAGVILQTDPSRKEKS